MWTQLCVCKKSLGRTLKMIITIAICIYNLWVCHHFCLQWLFCSLSPLPFRTYSSIHFHCHLQQQFLKVCFSFLFFFGLFIFLSLFLCVIIVCRRSDIKLGSSKFTLTDLVCNCLLRSNNCVTFLHSNKVCTMSKERHSTMVGGIVGVVWNVPTIFSGFVVASTSSPMSLV